MFFYPFLPKLLNMSLTASVAILFVLLLRLLLRKAPKIISYALWSIVLFRLLCPVSIQSGLSLFGLLDPIVVTDGAMASRMEYIPSDMIRADYRVESPALSAPSYTGIEGSGGGIPARGEEQQSADPLQAAMTIAACVWTAGTLAMLLHGAASYIRLRRKLLTASPLRENIYLADEITSPFVMGLFRPRIYLPSAMEGQEQSYILAHEQHHIRRLDYIVKVLAYAALCIHWFNPLVWAAFITAGRDMEMSCDEAVVRKMGADVLADYTASLLNLTVGKNVIAGKHAVAGMLLAFGEGDAKGRICNLANWKKPAFWVVLLSVIAGTAAAVCLLANPKQDEFSLRIIVPAGNREPVVYAHEEISPLGNYITVTNGDGLGDTEVSLKPVEVKTETAYDEPVYLTPGMPVKIEAEKGGWFRIGVNVQNNTDQDMEVYINVKNVTVRISDEIEPESFLMQAEILEVHDGYLLVKPESERELNSADRITVPVKNMDLALEPEVGDRIEVSYSGGILETYPAQLDDVRSIEIIAKEGAAQGDDSAEETQPPKLTFDDVVTLSQNGQDLTWSDFEQYDYMETGSGLYIRVYEIDEDALFRLWIGGGSMDSAPMYIYLALADDFDTRIDIREGGVEEFIAEHRSDGLLTQAIYNAILDHNMPANPDGLYHCADFVLLDKEEFCIDSEPPTPMQVTVYGFALHQAYAYSEGVLREALGSHLPVAITFEIRDGDYVLSEYWEPRDGSYYRKDILERFPDAIEEDALDTQKYILMQTQSCYAQAVEYGNVDTDSVIERLFEAVEESPRRFASGPGDYIDVHPIQYRELTYYGQYTLRHCFEQFLQGGQTGLHGQIMALACRDSMLAWEEGKEVGKDSANGQEWFDAFKSYAESLGAECSDEEMEKFYPGARLLLQMTGGR